MTMQLRIRHTTGYHYEKGAVASFNEARMTPMTTSEQYVLRSRLEISPTPWSYEYRDYWGTTVTSFEVHDPHQDLTVVATSIVDTQGTPPEPHGVAWDALDGGAGRVVRVPRDEQLGRTRAGAADRAGTDAS